MEWLVWGYFALKMSVNIVPLGIEPTALSVNVYIEPPIVYLAFVMLYAPLSALGADFEARCRLVSVSFTVITLLLAPPASDTLAVH